MSSPQAPAGGCRVARAIPVISQSARSKPPEQLEGPLDRPVRLQRVDAREPGRLRRRPRRPSGCTSSSTTRAGRSRCPRRGSSARAACSAGRCRSRPPRAARAGSRRRWASGIGAGGRSGGGKVDARRPGAPASKIVPRPAGPCVRTGAPGPHPATSAPARTSAIASAKASISSRVRRSVADRRSASLGSPGCGDAGQEPAIEHPIDHLVGVERAAERERRGRSERPGSGARRRGAREALGRVGGRSRAPLALLARGPSGPSHARWIVAASAISVWFVQMLEVAFSRRMCCSRACRVRTYPVRPSRSTVSRRSGPASSARRPSGSQQPEVRAPELQLVAEGLALPHRQVGAELARRREHPQAHRVEDLDQPRPRLVRHRGGGARRPRAIPKTFGCWTTTAAAPSGTAGGAARGRRAPPRLDSRHRVPAA